MGKDRIGEKIKGRKREGKDSKRRDEISPTLACQGSNITLNATLQTRDASLTHPYVTNSTEKKPEQQAVFPDKEF